STTCFEKRPRITLPPKPPRKKTVNNVREHPATCSGQALGLLVPVSSTPYKASTPGLSTPSSTGSLNPSKEAGDLISKQASRLDAFSGYPTRSNPTCHARGRTTGTSEVRPTRSSRTRDSPSHVSNARSG